MANFEFNLFRKREITQDMSLDERLLRDYLENKSPIKYKEHSLEGTVQDVLGLNEDLKAYVMDFLRTGEVDTDIECECATIHDLLQTQNFTPVTAAIFVQWCRRDPVQAARFLLHHDRITSIPDGLPEMEEPED